MIWLLLRPIPLSTRQARHTGRLRKRDNLPDGRGGGGGGGDKSYDSKKPWSSTYKSFNTVNVCIIQNWDPLQYQIGHFTLLSYLNGHRHEHFCPLKKRGQQMRMGTAKSPLIYSMYGHWGQLGIGHSWVTRRSRWGRWVKMIDSAAYCLWCMNGHCTHTRGCPIYQSNLLNNGKYRQLLGTLHRTNRRTNCSLLLLVVLEQFIAYYLL